MKFIHTADIHYSMKPDFSKPWAKEREQAIKNSLHTIVNSCKNYNVDCLFISGDLFHRQALQKELKEVNYLFSTIKNTKIIIILGNHDYLKVATPLYDFKWSDNVYILRNSRLSSIYFEDINTEVFGFSYHSNEISTNQIQGIKAPFNERINILMLHGGDTKHFPFNKEELINSGFSYTALGHIHKKEVFPGNTVVYAGSPEPLDHSESGKHGFFLGEINDVTRRLSMLKFIHSASLSYITLSLNVSSKTTNTELLMTISNEIKNRGVNNIYKLNIKGFRDPDINFDFDSLHHHFKIIQINDESEPNYDFNKLFSEHSSDMLGLYIDEFNKTELNDINKKALFYGVSALLKTSNERS